MTGESLPLGYEARSRLDAYLDAIDQALRAAGADRGARRSVTDDVEAQVLEMAEARFGGAPTAAQVDAVIGDLDPPEAYAREAGAGAGSRSGAAQQPAAPAPAPPAAPPAARPRLSRTALVGALWAPMVLLSGLLLLFFVGHRVESRPAPHPAASVDGPAVAAEPYSGPSAWHKVAAVGTIVLALLGLTAPFGTTICGVVAIVQIRNSGGLLYGMPLAIIDALLFPGLAVLGLLAVPILRLVAMA
jgi:hypothetical protein